MSDLSILLHPCRFDLMAKYLYIKHKQKQTNFFVEMYHKHLLTFNGCLEFADPTVMKSSEKTNIQDFINHFDNLIKSITHDGFDNEYPIPVGRNGVIINGAHRLVVSYFYKIAPVFKLYDIHGCVDYNYNFFVNRTEKPKLDNLYADCMALEYISHNKNVRCMIIYPVAYDEQMIKNIFDIIIEYGYVYYAKTISLNRNGISNLVKEIYRGEDWIGFFPRGFSPGKKAERCVAENPTTCVLIYMRDISKCAELKQKCRSLYQLEKHSLHISDDEVDTRRISSALLNDNSVHFLNNGTNELSSKTQRSLQTYFNQIQNENIHEYCLTSSLIMEMYNIRSARDIDYLHISDNKLKSVSLHGKEEEVYYPIHKEEIIYNPLYHFYFNSFKFATLNVVKMVKENRKEEKDVMDIKLIDLKQEAQSFSRIVS